MHVRKWPLWPETIRGLMKRQSAFKLQTDFVKPKGYGCNEAGELAAITQAGSWAFRRRKAPLALLALIAVVVLAAVGVAESTLG